MRTNLRAASGVKITLIVASVLTIIGLGAVVVSSQSIISYKIVDAASGDLRSSKDLIGEMETRIELDRADIKALSVLAVNDFNKGDYVSAATRWGEVSSLSPLDPEPLLQAGRSLYLAGDLASAEVVLTRELLNPSTDAKLVLSRIYLERNKRDEALSMLRGLQAQDPLNEEVILLLADALFRGGDLDEAEGFYRSLLHSTRNQIKTGSSIGLAQILFRSDRKDEGVLTLEQLNLNDSAASTMNVVADLYFNVREVDKGIAIYRQLISKYGSRASWVVTLAEELAGMKAVDALAQLRNSEIEIDLDGISARYYLDALASYVKTDCADFLGKMISATQHNQRPLAVWMQFDCATAIGDLATFEKIGSTSDLRNLAMPIKQRMHSMLISRAPAASAAGKNELAIKMAELSTDLDIDPVMAEIALGSALFSAGQYEKAMGQVREHLKSDLHWFAAKEITARSLLGLGQYEEAQVFFDELLTHALDTDRGRLLMWGGMAARESGDQLRAEQYFEFSFEKEGFAESGIRLIELYIEQQRWLSATQTATWFTRQETSDQKAIGEAYLGAVEIAQDNHKGAAERFLNAVKLTPDNVILYLRAADSFLAANLTPQAEKVLVEALEVRPNHPMVELRLSDVSVKEGKSELAIQRLNTLITKQPKWALPKYKLALILAKDDKSLEEAYRVASAAFELQPNAVLVEALVQELKQRVVELERSKPSSES